MGNEMNRIDRIKQMSVRELASLGVEDFAYIKRVVVDGQSGYAIHAADGTQIALLPDREVAFATVRQHDLEPVSVH